MIQRCSFGPHTANGWNFDHDRTFESALTIESPDGEDDGPVFGGMVARGPAGDLRLDESLFARIDLRPGLVCEAGGWAARTLAIRAYLADHPDAFFPAPEDARAAAGMPDGEVFVVSRAFRHVVGPAREGVEPQPWDVLPSESQTYRSLAEAIVSGDASRFVPGEPNLHWSLHAHEPDDFEVPWREHRANADGNLGYLRAAMAETGAARDDRGLLPLAEARSIVAAHPRIARGEGRWAKTADGEDLWVWDLDLVWAALLSLEDAAEAAKALGALALVDPPRAGAKNAALVQRYGDAAAAIVRSLARPDGVVVAGSPFLRATVVALGTPAGFALAYGLPGWLEPGVEASADAQATSLFVAWMAAHPALGYVELARLVEAGDDNALGFLKPWAAPQARKVFGWIRDGLGDEVARRVFDRIDIPVALAPSHVLACLDAHARGQSGGEDGWPLFRTGQGPSRELHGLRLVAARKPEGEDWIIVLERCEGYGQSAAVARYVVSESVPGGIRPDLARPLMDALHEELARAQPDEADAALIEPPDYWTKVDGAPAQVARMRAVLRAAPKRVWPDPADTLAAVGFAGVAPLVVTTVFAHTAGTKGGGPLPSELGSYVSLAEAIVTRDAARFAPGESNLAPALHVGRAEEDEGEGDEEEEGEDEDASSPE
jgi:hypothetical protein